LWVLEPEHLAASGYFCHLLHVVKGNDVAHVNFSSKVITVSMTELVAMM
jgi:hypothetical protein